MQWFPTIATVQTIISQPVTIAAQTPYVDSSDLIDVKWMNQTCTGEALDRDRFRAKDQVKS
jgi:hypothetical protein